MNQLTGERDLSKAKAVPPKQRAERASCGGGPQRSPSASYGWVNQLIGERKTAKAVPPKLRAKRALSGGGPYEFIFRAECTRLIRALEAIGQRLATLRRMFVEKHWVYVLQSSVLPDKHYVGLTSDVDARLTFHNEGRAPYTASAAPWQLLVAIRFRDSHSASAFERYLKSGSGRAFATRHFV